jgi:carboxypeptidase family protein
MSGMILRPAIVASTLAIAVAAAACGGSKPPTQPTSPSGSSFVVSGVIREKLLAAGGLGLPVKGVRVEGPGQSATTDDEGRYSMAVAGGSFDLRLSKDGYQPAVLRVEALSSNRTLDGAIDPILRTLTGKVTDASSNSPLVGVRLEILSGSNKGRLAGTGMNGEYTFGGVWGDFDVSISVLGYGATTVRAAVDATVTRVDVRLNSNVPMTRTVFTGQLCTVEPVLSYSRLCQGSSFPYPVQAHHSFDMPRPGTLTLGVSYAYVGDYYMNYLNVELRCGSQVITEKRVRLLWEGPPVTEPDNVIGPVQIALPQACNYEIKLFNYIADRKGGDWTTYRVEVGYPR